MTVSHAAATKIFLGIVLSIFCGVLILYSLRIGRILGPLLTTLIATAIILYRAHQRNAIHNPDKN